MTIRVPLLKENLSVFGAARYRFCRASQEESAQTAKYSSICPVLARAAGEWNGVFAWHPPAAAAALWKDDITSVQHRIFITGGTGYIGCRLIPLLMARGHQLTALVRCGSETKVPAGCSTFVGDALDGNSNRAQLAEHHTLIHLVGVPHPSPAKAREFVAVDLRSAQEAVRAAAGAGIHHFIYVSVAQPAPVMKAYLDVRAQCEASLRISGLNATILRPWYVLGPGHRWPLVLKPFYGVLHD